MERCNGQSESLIPWNSFRRGNGCARQVTNRRRMTKNHSNCMSASHDVTRLLIDWGNGNEAARDQLLPLIYGELRRLAERYLSRERPGHTLQPPRSSTKPTFAWWNKAIPNGRIAPTSLQLRRK